MPKALRLVIAGVIVLIIGAVVYNTATRSTTTSTPNPSPTVIQEEPVADDQPASATSKPGSYVDYSSEAVAATTGTKILFFHAPWCPQCRALDASIKAGEVPSDTTIFKVDYDTNQKLRQKYGVTIQTTLVKLDDSGNEVKKFVAYDQPNLAAVISNLD